MWYQQVGSTLDRYAHLFIIPPVFCGKMSEDVLTNLLSQNFTNLVLVDPAGWDQKRFGC